MKRAVTLIALLASALHDDGAEIYPARPGDPGVLAGRRSLSRTGRGRLAGPYLPQVFTDPRLRTLIAQALVNNRDLMVAASNIAAAREQYRIQRAQQLPTVNSSAGVTVSGDKWPNDVECAIYGWRQRPQLRARSVRPGALADACPARTISGDRSGCAVHPPDPRRGCSQRVARSCRRFEPAADLAGNGCERQKSVNLTRIRLEGGIAPRTDLSQAEQILAAAQADLAQQRTAVAQDVNALQLLVGAPIDPKLLSGSIDDAFGHIAPVPAGLDSYVLLRRPDVLQAEYQLRAANAQIGAARAALFPRISLTGLLGFASSALSSCSPAAHSAGAPAPTRPTPSSRAAPVTPTFASAKPSAMPRSRPTSTPSRPRSARSPTHWPAAARSTTKSLPASASSSRPPTPIR